MSEIAKTAGQLIVNNLSITLIIVLWILGGLFKITKKEINPLGWLASKIGNALTRGIQKDVADFKKETNSNFSRIKSDRKEQVDILKKDYNAQITELRSDLDSFEKRTDASIKEIKTGSNKNCEAMKKRLDKMEESNDRQTVRQIRAHVLDFANSCLNGRKHTKLEFENIINENAAYEVLCKKYKIKNQVYKEDYDYIIKVYHKCQEEGSFLKEKDIAS